MCRFQMCNFARANVFIAAIVESDIFAHKAAKVCFTSSFYGMKICVRDGGIPGNERNVCRYMNVQPGPKATPLMILNIGFLISGF